VGGGRAIIFLNSFDSDYCCPKSFEDVRLHKSAVVDCDEKEYQIKCVCCNTTHYKGEDVFREENVELLKAANKFNLDTLAFITAPKKSIQNQIDYYENYYPGFLGYKIHPTIMMYPAENLCVKSAKTIVFHSGNDYYSSPHQIIKFAKRYEGNVVIAHFARFDKSSLQTISKMDNVWVDTSPFTYLYSLLLNKPHRLCCENEHKGINDLLYHLIDMVGCEKVLFASDSPWGNLSDEVNFIKGLNFNDDELKKILYTNACDAFNIDK
jgi:predicted TIM-barrel fold metal-dependent hydrolase